MKVFILYRICIIHHSHTVMIVWMEGQGHIFTFGSISIFVWGNVSCGGVLHSLNGILDVY